MQPRDPAAISRLFSSTVVHELAEEGMSPLFARLFRECNFAEAPSPATQVRDVFEEAYEILKTAGNRNEYVYKAALTQKVLLGKHTLKTASMLTEFRVGNCKADIVILNGTATAYEIKSERDSLARLQQQVGEYRTVFASVCVILGQPHLESALAIVPDDVGVQVLSDQFTLRVIRAPVDCPDRTVPSAIFDSIRLKEAMQILQSNGYICPSVPNTELHAELLKEFKKLSPTQAHAGMVQVLKTSRSLTSLAAFLNNLPPSLKVAALTIPKRKSNYARFISAINTPLQTALNWA